jgi:glyoxylase-like metal-dependent hydrolase (beta-lactamase superfamily II)
MPAHAEEFSSLSETLYHWSVFEPAVKCEIGCSALKLASGWVVVDPVPLAPASWEELLALAPVRAILLTNGNHVRDAAALKKQHAVPIVTAAEARRDITELRPDIALLPGELLYGITGIAIPGATPGETAFLSDTGVLLLGDAVINTSTERGLELLPEKYCSDAKQNRASLQKLLSLDFHTITFAHGAPITTHAKQKLSALLAT